jgi:uncharacterized protein (DUF305 family)
MSITDTPPPNTDDLEATDEPRVRPPLTVVLMCVLATAVLAIAATAGWLAADRGGSGSAIDDSSVDAGFARDMSTHHTQAVIMAGYTRDHTSDPSIELLAYDIETSQYFELGQMQGWLDSWGLPRGTHRTSMAWMAGHSHSLPGGLMPELATPAQMDSLERLTGRALDIDFLQMMIHHHQGAIPMAQYGGRTRPDRVRPQPRPENARRTEQRNHRHGAVAARPRRDSMPAPS